MTIGREFETRQIQLDKKDYLDNRRAKRESLIAWNEQRNGYIDNLSELGQKIEGDVWFKTFKQIHGKALDIARSAWGHSPTVEVTDIYYQTVEGLGDNREGIEYAGLLVVSKSARANNANNTLYLNDNEGLRTFDIHLEKGKGLLRNFSITETVPIEGSNPGAQLVRLTKKTHLLDLAQFGGYVRDTGGKVIGKINLAKVADVELLSNFRELEDSRENFYSVVMKRGSQQLPINFRRRFLSIKEKLTVMNDRLDKYELISDDKSNIYYQTFISPALKLANKPAPLPIKSKRQIYKKDRK